jgi:streptomycin 6-kinase
MIAIWSKPSAGGLSRAGSRSTISRPSCFTGDLTPSNILDGGTERGLVVIDPAPCLGDAAFDAVDLILWQAEDLQTIHARAERLAAVTGMEIRRVLAWCSAFASMNALEIASQGSSPSTRIEALLKLASQT